MNWTVMGPHWLFGFFEIRYGKAYHFQSKDALLCPKQFAILLPPSALVQSDDRSAEVYFEGRMFHGSLPPPPPETLRGLPAKAQIFLPASWSLPTDPRKIWDFLKQGTHFQTVEVLKNPSYLVEQAKRKVDGSLGQKLKMSELAFQLKTNPGALSREFKTQTGISLTEYHERLQASDLEFLKRPQGEVFKSQGLSFPAKA